MKFSLNNTFPENWKYVDLPVHQVLVKDPNYILWINENTDHRFAPGIIEIATSLSSFYEDIRNRVFKIQEAAHSARAVQSMAQQFPSVAGKLIEEGIDETFYEETQYDDMMPSSWDDGEFYK